MVLQNKKKIKNNENMLLTEQDPIKIKKIKDRIAFLKKLKSDLFGFKHNLEYGFYSINRKIKNNIEKLKTEKDPAKIKEIKDRIDFLKQRLSDLKINFQKEFNFLKSKANRV